MGGRDVGYMSHLLPGQRQIANPDHRQQMEQFWGLRPGTIHPHAGYDAVNLFDAVSTGEIRALWIVGTNPAASMPNLPRVRAALEAAELVIVQDAYYPTETTGYADILFPAAVNLEQAGTFCNSERRVSLMEQVVAPPGDAQARLVVVQAGRRCDWAFARRCDSRRPTRSSTSLPASPPGRPNDQKRAVARIACARKARSSGLIRHWADRRRVAMKMDRFPTASGRARFLRGRTAPPEETPDQEYPLVLTTGRVAGHWHTRTKTGLVRAIEQTGRSAVPADARGRCVVIGVARRPARGGPQPPGKDHVTSSHRSRSSRGTVFMPIHWNELWAESSSPNEVTTDAADATSRQPALKCLRGSVSAAGVSDRELSNPLAAAISPVPVAVS